MSTETQLTVQRTAHYYEIGKRDATDFWLVLHGYGQLAGEFVEHFQPISGDRRIVAPEALSRFYSRNGVRVGASWMTRHNRKTEIEDYVRYLDAAVRSAGHAPADTTVVGFSQGGHTACRWVAAQSAVRRLILWGSALPGDLQFDKFASALAGRSVTLIAGRQDRFVRDADLERGLDDLRRLQLDAELVRFDGGHDIPPDVLQRIASQEPS